MVLPPKTHLYFNHSPITKLVIEQILAQSHDPAHDARALVVSTRGQKLGVAGIDELCFDDEQLAQDIEVAYRFFHDAPPHTFDRLTVFVPQTRYPLGHFLLSSPLVETLHYIEEGVGTMSFGRIETRIASSARNITPRRGMLDNSLPGRVFRAATRVPMHLLAHPGRIDQLANLTRFYGSEVHFMWRPEWHPRIGRLFTFHDVWPAAHQTILRFPIPTQRRPRDTTALLLLPAVYRRKLADRFSAHVTAFFDGLPAHHHIEVKCHPSDTEYYWLARCRELHANVSEVNDRMTEAALYCYAHDIPICCHFNSSSKEYFKFLPWNAGHPPPAVVDLWPAPLRLIDISGMDPDARPSSQFEFPLPDGASASPR